MNSEVLKSSVSITAFIAFFVCLIIYTVLAKKFTSVNSKYNKLHKLSVIFLVYGVAIIFIFGISILVNKTNKSSNTSTADGFTIEEYKIVMDVNEANSTDVKEYITVNFYEEGHHGIYRFIPSWLEYTDKNGITKSRKAKISNLKAIGDNYKIDTVNGKKRIKIGDENNTLPTANHTYEINYTYDMGYDPYSDFDEFIFHAFGDYWGTEIKNAEIIINLPKEIDSSDNIKFFADKYREEDITSYVNYYISGKTIYANLKSYYELNSALTIDIELPDLYFINKNNSYGIISLTICLLCIIFAIISFIFWKKNGKDLNKPIETIEFYPPDELDTAEIGYLYKKDTGKKLTIALIIELASKGFIKIIESDDKKTQTIIKSNKTDINEYIKREIKISKLKDFNEKLQGMNELMKEYFPNNKNEYVLTSDFDYFYKNSEYLVNNGYIKIESDTINKYTKEELDKIKEELSLKYEKNKQKMSSNEKIVYDNLFKNSDETILSKNYTFYKVFKKIGENVRNTLDDKIYDLNSIKYMTITSFGFFICTFLLGLAYCKIKDLDSKLSILYVIAFISNIITFIFSLLMKRKNSYGEKMQARIKGFKNYIEFAKKNQIDLLVEENPNYFYDILPYAYILGVSKKWVEKFENIKIPTNDMGNFDYYNPDSIDNLSNSIHVPSSDSSGTGGCSSCGGGCSSCGGGGSW